MIELAELAQDEEEAGITQADALWKQESDARIKVAEAEKALRQARSYLEKTVSTRRMVVNYLARFHMGALSVDPERLR